MSLPRPLQAKALQPGDTLAVISPAAPSQPHEMDMGVSYLKNLGFQVKVMPHARTAAHYLAGNDAERLADLHAAFADPDVDGILAARGGYGCMRLLPHLDWNLIQAHPKVIIGFSDLTALLLPLYERTGLMGFHGPMLTSNLIEGDSYTQSELWKQVMGQATYPYRIPNQTTYHCLHAGTCEAPLMGGNFSLLAALCGTPYQPHPVDHVLFIEDWREDFYSLDRQWMQLKLAGMFEGIRGLLLCDFAEMKESTWSDYTLIDCFRALTEELSVPVGIGFSVGHGGQTATLPIGSVVRFEATSGHLEILSAPVRVRSSSAAQATPS